MHKTFVDLVLHQSAEDSELLKPNSMSTTNPGNSETFSIVIAQPFNIFLCSFSVKKILWKDDVRLNDSLIQLDSIGFFLWF